MRYMVYDDNQAADSQAQALRQRTEKHLAASPLTTHLAADPLPLTRRSAPGPSPLSHLTSVSDPPHLALTPPSAMGHMGLP